MGYFDTRIHDNTDISWVIDAISRQIAWPLGYFKIVVGTRPFEYVHRLKDRDCTLLQDLREECLQEGTINSEDPLPITLVLHCPPETFDNNMCICEFPGYGCCITGRSDNGGCALTVADGPSDDDVKRKVRFLKWRHEGCKRCGNCGICRSGNCGHACCEKLVTRFDRA